MVLSKTWGSRLADGFILLILLVSALLSVAPIVHTLAVSLSNKAAADADLVYFWPVRFNLHSYVKLVQDPAFFRAFGISVERVLLGGAINFLMTVLMAYPLSKDAKQFPARKYYVWFVVFTMLFNGGLIPWYMTISKLGLMNTIWALALPGAVPVFNVILLLNFFRGIPKGLEEAAWVDGAGPWYILWKVFVPLSTPALATVTLFSVLGHWNSFFDGLILMNDPKNYPLQTYIQQLVVQIQTLSTMTPDQIRAMLSISDTTLNSAKLFVAMLPVLIAYPFAQRYFIHGIVLGAVKE